MLDEPLSGLPLVDLLDFLLKLFLSVLFILQIPLSLLQLKFLLHELIGVMRMIFVGGAVRIRRFIASVFTSQEPIFLSPLPFTLQNSFLFFFKVN